MRANRHRRAAILCGLGLFAVSSLPMDRSVDDRGGILSAVMTPIRMIQREAIAQEGVTPSHVYQQASDLISEIEVLREAIGVTDEPLEHEPVTDRQPLHVYSKVLELQHKIAAAQRRLGMSPATVGQIPVKQIAPADVKGAVEYALAQVRRIKTQMHIEDEISPAPLEGGKTPSDVYQWVGDASYLLDGLVGHPIDLNDVYTDLLALHGDMELVATKLKVALQIDPPEVTGRKRLKEIGQQVLRSTFKLINLQTRLGMDASSVPEVHLVRITPANLFETISMMDAEMVRIKHHLGINLPHEEHGAVRNKKKRDVFAMVLLVIKNLDILAKGADAYVETQS